MPIDHRSIVESIERLKLKGKPFEDGLSDKEIASVESRFGFTFPPELRFFLQTALPTSDYFPNWRSDSVERLQSWLDRPIDGVLFDIERNDFWHDDWESKPSELPAALETARHHVEQMPKLIPIGDRIYLKCVPASPVSPGNPVFSINQTDALHGGRDLCEFLNWFSRPDSAFDEDDESGDPLTALYDESYRVIPFWTDLVRLNNS